MSQRAGLKQSWGHRESRTAGAGQIEFGRKRKVYRELPGKLADPQWVNPKVAVIVKVEPH